MQDEEQIMDWLAVKTLESLKKVDNPASWVKDKESEFVGMTRFEVLRSFLNFDCHNREAIADSLGVDFYDLEATLRVMRKI